MDLSISSILNFLKRIAVLCVTVVVAVLMTGIASAFNVYATSLLDPQIQNVGAAPQFEMSSDLITSEQGQMSIEQAELVRPELSKSYAQTQSIPAGTEVQTPMPVSKNEPDVLMTEGYDTIISEAIPFELPVTGGPDISFLPDSVVRYCVNIAASDKRLLTNDNWTSFSLNSSMMLVSAVISCVVSKQYYFGESDLNVEPSYGNLD